MTQRTKDLGKAGEHFAANFLQNNGYKILVQNFRIRRAEIDIVAEINDTIIFVEVKTRTGNAFGLPAEAVDIHKQKKIITAAMSFLQKYDLFNKLCRFDVIEVFANDNKNFYGWKVNHIKNAFEVTEY
ncbi:MAG: YraN family protein [Selenomonadaceae bacterium]|nr:YraN family protein [Selenomonadaceae bacterium]